MVVGAGQIYATLMNIGIFRSVTCLSRYVSSDVAKKLKPVCYGPTLKKRATCSSIYLVQISLTAGLSPQKTGLYIHHRESFKFLLVKLNEKIQFGSVSVDHVLSMLKKRST